MYKKVLILYSKTGGGHYRAAQTIASKLSEFDSNIEVKLVDGLAETNFGLKYDPASSYMIMSGPLLWLYNLSYVLTNTPIGLKMLRSMIKSIWGIHYKKLIQKEKPDLIISTHHFISPSTIADWKQQIPYLMVVTDLGNPHQIWFDPKADWLIVPTEDIRKYAQKWVAEKKIVRLGYPINHSILKFKSDPPKEKSILLIGSGWPVMSFLRLIRRIHKVYPDYKLNVVCGHNQILEKVMIQNFWKNVTIHGFVNNLPELMHQSTMVVTKPGPATILEAAILQRPMIVGKSVGLQEAGNVDFVKSQRLGIYSPDINTAIKAIKKIENNYQGYVHQQSKQFAGVNEIAQFILSQL